MHAKLTTKLNLAIVGLTTLVVFLTTSALSLGIYVLTEREFKLLLAEGAKEVIVDYLEVVDGKVVAQERADGLVLGVMLRNRDFSAKLIDSEGETLARYGIERDIPDLLPAVKKVTTGSYEDIGVTGYGIFDTYTVPIKVGDKIYGYLRLMRKNTELVVLRNAVLAAAVIVLPISWVLAAMVAWLVGRRVTAPLKSLVADLEAISPEVEELRVVNPSAKMDHEVWVVSQAIARLMHRLRESMSRQRQITENISHEFKTPLTRIVGYLQIGKVKEATAALLELGGNVDALLSLAIWEKTEASVDLVSILKKQMETVPTSVKLEYDLPNKLVVPIPQEHARVIWRNVIDNAVKHNDTRGHIRIVGRKDERSWRIEVTNGTRLTPKETGKITERKYRRGEQAGYGIGMSIVAEMCKLHELCLELQESKGEVTVMIRGEA